MFSTRGICLAVKEHLCNNQGFLCTGRFLAFPAHLCSFLFHLAFPLTFSSGYLFCSALIFAPSGLSSLPICSIQGFSKSGFAVIFLIASLPSQWQFKAETFPQILSSYPFLASKATPPPPTSRSFLPLYTFCLTLKWYFVLGEGGGLVACNFWFLAGLPSPATQFKFGAWRRHSGAVSAGSHWACRHRKPGLTALPCHLV